MPKAPNNSDTYSRSTRGGTATTKSQPDMLDTLVTWLFRLITFPLWLITVVFNQMLTPGAAGSSFLGKCVFIFLTVLSSDSYWQMLFEIGRASCRERV